VRIALTADDAPSIAAGRCGVRFDPGRLDRLCEVLQAQSIPHCVAFVIGAAAEGHEAALARWLAAGYELGNHTHDHVAASRTSVAAYLASVRRCDALLAATGAFAAGRRRWFRYPYLDRGADPATRAAIAAGVRELGYQPVHATIDLFDHAYEAALARARAAGDPAAAAAVGGRFERVALASVRRADRAARRAAGRPVDHIAFFHFGAVCEERLAPLLAGCRALGVAWTRVEQAIDEPLHRDYDGDPARSGLVTGGLDRGLADRVGGRLARLLDRLDPCRARRGPAFPHRH
jgi:peptidoglycan/xylan/chitin deacetylase (PgdA/CDA1 family)